MKSPFYSARLKVERAKEHINDLYQRGQIFIDERKHAITVERNPNTGRDSLRVAPAAPLPEELLLVLGDAIHNLRTALDHAWMQVVVTPSSFTKFPFRETKEGLEAAIGGLKENVCEDIKRFIVNDIQPYRGGKCQMLLDLHNLDIEDKHRLLIAHREFTFITGVKAKDQRGEEFNIPDWLVVPPHVVSQPFEGHDIFEITDYGKARTLISFGDGMPLQGQNILSTMRDISEIISGLIDCFDVIMAKQNFEFNNFDRHVKNI